MEEFIDQGMRVRSIGNSGRNYIREDGMKITKKKGGQLSYFKGSSHRSGYVVLSTGSGQDMAHRVVAKAFLPNPDNLPIVDHIDNNSHNNHVSNLRWVTNKQNCIYYHTEQKKGTRKAPSNEAMLLVQLNKATTTIGILKELIATKQATIAEYKAALKDVILGNPLPSIAKDIAIGNTIVVDGKIFGGTGSAATYIAEMEKVVGNTRNTETINKELKKIVKGTRPAGVMYGKYTIDY